MAHVVPQRSQSYSFTVVKLSNNIRRILHCITGIVLLCIYNMFLVNTRETKSTIIWEVSEIDE